MNGFTWIEPEQIRFYKEPRGWLAASWSGRDGPVTAMRLFPVTHPDGAIRISGIRGDEWGLLRTTANLLPQSRHALENELRISPYFPQIESIVSLRRSRESFEWTTLTDCGPVRFESGPLYEAVAEWPDGRRAVTDLSGQQYLLPADRDLDPHSRKRLTRWL